MNRIGWVLLSLATAAISARAEILWVANAGASSVSVIDTRKANRVVNIPLGAGSTPVEVAVNPFFPEVYVTDASRASLWVLSYVSQAVITEIPLSIVSPFGLAVMPLGGRVYVGNADGGITSGLISVVNTRLRREERVIDISPQGLVALDLAVTPVQATRLYIACNGTDSVAAVNTQTNTLVGAPFPLLLGTAASAPFAIALRPDNRFLYVCDDDPTGAASEVVVFDVPTLTPLTVALAAGERATDVACHPNNRKAYVCTGGGGTVRILNTVVHTFVSNVIRVPAGAIPAKVGLNERGTLGVFTEQAGSGAITFQTLADVVISPSIGTGATPFGCAIAAITSDPIGARARQRQLRGGRNRGLW